MRIRLFTLKREDASLFEDDIPKSVCDRIGQRAYFTLCAADVYNDPAGLCQFFVGQLSDGRSIAEIVFVYVKEEYRRQGVASRLISGALATMEDSSIGRVAVFLHNNEAEAESFFSSAGFIGLKPDGNMKEYFDGRYGTEDNPEHTLLMRFIGDFGGEWRY
jgi:ribosomal protein S18 acetylase RimI-like enzyme